MLSHGCTASAPRLGVLLISAVLLLAVGCRVVDSEIGGKSHSLPLMTRLVTDSLTHEPNTISTVQHTEIDACPADAPSPIDLGSSLRLAGVDNPMIALARERVREAAANHTASRTLLLPSINAGSNLRIHRGALQDDPGFLRQPSLQSLYVGGGTGAIGAGTVAIPGIWLLSHPGDALFEPLVARQRLAARQFEADAVRNATLLEVTTAYLELSGAQARLDILKRNEAAAADIARVTMDFARAGQGAPSDANRASANSDLFRRNRYDAEGTVAASSARLCRLLNLPPVPPVRPLGAPEVLRLVPEDLALDSLIAIAMRSRPEAFARSAAIVEAQSRVRQEKARPWLPLLMMGYSGGGFGGGSDLIADRFSSLKERSDFDVVAVWNIQNSGIGNHSRQSQANAALGQAIANHQNTVNQIRREVAEAQANAKAAARQIEVARQSLAAAEEGFRLDKDRITRGEGRPIEVLDSLRQFSDAQLELLRAVVAFDVAQFQLHVALGSPPPEATSLDSIPK